MSVTWTWTQTTQGPRWTSETGEQRRLVMATAYPVGAVARTSEASGACYVYDDVLLTAGETGTIKSQAWRRVGDGQLVGWFDAQDVTRATGSSVLVTW